MDEEIVEKPESVIQYEQTKVLEENEEEETEENVPKIVDMKLKEKYVNLETTIMKKPLDTPRKNLKPNLEANVSGFSKTIFAKNLEEKLAKHSTYMEMTAPQINEQRCSSMYLEMKLIENSNETPVGESHIYNEPIFKDEINVALIKALKTRPKTIDSENIDEKTKMATLRPKSPKPIITKNNEKESVWDKIGTLGRKKRSKEVQEVQEEGKYAIDSPGFAVTPVISPEDYDLDENEERSIIMPKAFEDPKLRELIQVLIDWINDELASQRIIVQDLTEDLYDGQVLQKLFEMLTGHKLDVPEVTQSEEGQKQKLSVVLSHFNRVLGLPHNHNKWNVESIHSKNIVPILHLLIAIARHFRPPVRLPENVSVSVTVVQKSQGQLTHRIVREVITSEYSDVGMRCERDAFDTLFDHAPDKLQVVKKSMVTFVNKHLNKLNLEVTEIETQFHDGVYLIMLMGLLEGFFVPLYSFFPTPKDNDQKIHNVSFAFELMEECGLARPKARPEDVVNLDLKSTLRVLYNLFNKYKSLL